LQALFRDIVLSGKNITAPLSVKPTAILDCGCGVAGTLCPQHLLRSRLKCPGAWVIDVAKEFPEAKVVGIDLSPVRKEVIYPPTCEFVTGDITRVLTTEFKEGQFDYIHSR